MDKVTTIAVDLGKRAFSVYWVEPESGEIGTKAMTRAKLEEFMRTREGCRVVLEAGGSAHHWGRWLRRLGHEVRLIAPQHVRAFVRTNKTDLGDARAIWEAAHRPEVKWVAVKSEASQAVLALHRMRRQLMKMRRMQASQLKALLYEFGVVAPLKVGSAHVKDWVGAGRVPQLLEVSLCGQIEQIAQLKRQELGLTRAIERQNSNDELALRLLAVPGIGTLTASALSAELAAGASGFGSGRQYAACKGMAPRLSGTGGKVRSGAISKRGDSVCAHAAHPRGSQRDHAPEAGQAAIAVAERIARAPAAQCGGCGARQQDGAYGLGASRPRAGVPATLRRASGVAD